MEKEEALKKIEEMMQNDREWLKKECIRLLNTGGIDPEDYNDDFILSKIVYNTALRGLLIQRDLMHPEHKKIADNLFLF